MYEGVSCSIPLDFFRDALDFHWALKVPGVDPNLVAATTLQKVVVSLGALVSKLPSKGVQCVHWEPKPSEHGSIPSPVRPTAA